MTPDALTHAHWQSWSDGNRISRHLRTLLNEAGDGLGACEPGLKKLSAVTFSNTGAIHRWIDFQEVSTYVGFWPSRRPVTQDECALVTVYVLNKNMPVEERKEASRAAVERAATPSVALSGWSDYHVVRTTPAPQVLDAHDFNSQRDQLVEHFKDALRFFRDLGYLDPLQPLLEAVEAEPEAGGNNNVG